MFAAPGFEILIIAGVWSLVAGAAAGGVINCDGGRWQPLDTQARDRELTVSCQERAQSGSGPPTTTATLLITASARPQHRDDISII